MGGSKRKRHRARRAAAGRAVPPPPPWEELLRPFIRFAGPIAILVTGVAMLAWTWRTWPDPLGNYNWLCPYAYELPHGVMLAVAGFWFLDRYHRTRRLGWLTATGAALGLVALTKTEALFAAAIAGAVGLALTVVAERPTTAR